MPSPSPVLDPNPPRRCPKCAEPIQQEARACRFCGTDLRPWAYKHPALALFLIVFGIGLVSQALSHPSTRSNVAAPRPATVAPSASQPAQAPARVPPTLPTPVPARVASNQAAPASAPSTVATAAPPPAAQTPVATGSAPVDAATLVRDYQANEVAADLRYKGRELLVSGKVATIGKDLFDAPYVTLEGDGMFSTVHCGLDAGDADRAAGLTVGATLVLGGTGDGMTLGSPSLRPCRIVSGGSTAPLQATAPDGPVRVTATELSQAYEANEVAADRLYKGRTLVVTGVVDSIDKGFTDDVFVRLTGASFLGSAQCSVDPSDVAKAAALAKGATVTVTGVGDGAILGSPKIATCRLP